MTGNVDLRRSQGVQAVNLGPAGAPPPYFMQSDAIRLTWRTTAFGLQPVRLERRDGGGSIEFAEFPVWRVEFQDAIGEPKEVVTPADVGPEYASISRVSLLQWIVTWDVNGLLIQYTVTLEGDEVHWSFEADANNTGRRLSSMVMPAIRVKRQSSTPRAERVLIPTLATAFADRLELLGAGLTQPVFGSLPTFAFDAPGFMALDLAGYWLQGSGSYFMQWTTDEVGSLKTWHFGNDGVGDEETAEAHMGIQHFVPGASPGNTWTSAYEVRWAIGTAEPEHEWYDMALRWRAWSESLSPAPSWLQPFEPSKDIEEALIIAAHFYVHDEDGSSAEPATPQLATEAMAGQTFVDVDLMTVPPSMGDMIAVPSLESLPAYYRVASTEAAGGHTRIHLDRPLQYFAPFRLSLRMHGPTERTEASCPTQMLDSALRFASYLGISPSRMVDLWYAWAGAAGVWADGDERQTGLPFFEGTTGIPDDLISALEDAEAAGLSIGLYTLWINMSQGRLMQELGFADRAILLDSNEIIQKIITVMDTGPNARVNLDSAALQDFLVQHWRTIAFAYGARGAYLDAHNGPAVATDFSATLPEDERASPVAVHRGLIDIAKEFRAGAREPEELEAVLQDERGHILTDETGEPLEGDLPTKHRPEFWTSSEYKTHWSAGSIDLHASKYTLLRTLLMVPVPEFWRVAMGGAHPVHDLTDCYITNRNRVADIGDFDFTTALVRLGLMLHNFHAGLIPSAICIGEVQNLTASDFVKGDASGATLYPYERVICESLRDSVQWDSLDYVREFRRKGTLERPVKGGHFLESLTASNDLALVSTGLVMASAYSSPEHAGTLLVIVSSWSLVGEVTAEITLSGDRYAEVTDGAVINQVGQDGTRTLVGAVVHGSAAWQVSINPGLTRVYEVK